MRKRKIWLSLLLAASMALSCPAFADVGEADAAVENAAEEADTEAVDESVSEEPEAVSEPESEDKTDEPEEQEPAEVEAEETAEEENVLLLSPEEEKPTVSWKDNGDGKIDLELQNYTRDDSVRAVKFAVWSAKNGQDDIKWYDADADLKYQMDTRNHGDDLGSYYVHVYAEKNDGKSEFVCDLTASVSSIERSEPSIKAEDKAGDEKVFSLSLENYEKTSDVQNVVAAIWSEKDGQDDLKWYTMKESADGKFTLDFRPADHKTSGIYQIHVYASDKSGKSSQITRGTVSVSGITPGTITVSDTDSAKGRCTVTLSGVSCPSGITKVQIPVWSQKKQADIVWYTAELQEDGTYQIVIDIAKHKNNLGTYTIHAYATAGNGFMENIAASSVEFKASEAEVTVTKKNDKYLLETTGIAAPGGVESVKYAVWSDENGQDDLKWIDAKYDADKASAKYNLSLKGFKSYGMYQVHSYGVTKNGGLVFLGRNTFTVEAAVLESIEITADNDTGDFEIELKGLKSDSGVTKVQVPVWSKSNQSDIVWYTAEKTGEGTYRVKSSIASHKYNTGTYHAHVYVTENNGITSYLKGKDFTFSKASGGIEVGEGKDQKTFPLTVKGVSVPAGAKTVKAAVWSEDGGQDDLKWYTLTGKNGGDYTGTIDIANHKSQGTYQVHAYVVTRGGSEEIIGMTTFQVESSAAASVKVTGTNASAGSFDLQITVAESNSSVSGVSVPVWSKSDMSDIHWYTAKKQSDGTFACTVKISNHKLSLGKYQIHVYTKFTNGIQSFAGSGSYTFNPPNVLAVTKPSDGKRKVTLKNAGGSVTSVSFAVWSDDKGQDDVVWYSASKQSDGSWAATVQSSKHKSSGNYQVHCYQNGTFTCNTTLSFAKSEMVKNGWYYENGYKFYYSNGKKLKDLTSVIGAQSSYVAMVNRVTCTITIYANDPDSSRGYIIPVKAFTCSVGLPGTPTTAGVHYTFAKYRWKELMGPSYGQYATKFTSDGIYFHSVAGVNTTSYNLNSIDYNNLGGPASHGCVRLCVRDAKWIYDNCPLGMKVVVYDSGDPGPYGKPATIKIPAGQTWDPTDPAVG